MLPSVQNPLYSHPLFITLKVNIKIYLGEMGLKDVNLIELAVNTLIW
jgi:hypothetical protein